MLVIIVSQQLLHCAHIRAGCVQFFFQFYLIRFCSGSSGTFDMYKCNHLETLKTVIVIVSTS